MAYFKIKFPWFKSSRTKEQSNSDSSKHQHQKDTSSFKEFNEKHSEMVLGFGSKKPKNLPPETLPERPKENISVQIHPLPTEDGLIVKIQPPKEPAAGSTPSAATPCDLVLCIDVSGSMYDEAPAPATQTGIVEDLGLSILDLVKHASRTIIETLDGKDRLGIVTFASQSKVLQPLTHMTPENKSATLKKIKEMVPLDMTNLWHGLRDSLNLFRDEEGKPKHSGRLPVVLVLTDGQPNHMCPPQGYIPKLQSMGALPATIHTFGFGYYLRSGLLKSLAEFGGGNYSFIPDAGMIGTAFIHAVANLQSTVANNAKLHITYPTYLQLEETTGEAVDKQPPVTLGGDVPDCLSQLTISLGNIQYGQSKDIYLRYGGEAQGAALLHKHAEATGQAPIVTVELQWQQFTSTIFSESTQKNILEKHTLSLEPNEIAYHISRSALISFLGSLFPLNAELEHNPLGFSLEGADDQAQKVRDIAAFLRKTAVYPPTKSIDNTSDSTELTLSPLCKPLFLDLLGPIPAPEQTQSPISLDDFISGPSSSWTGQIALAITRKEYHSRWGIHYLPSLASAYARQVCNTFKDFGPQAFGSESPLFKACRDRLGQIFDSLPPPEGSRPRTADPDGITSGIASMSIYNNPCAGCFAGLARVAVVVRPAGGKCRGNEVGVEWERKWVRIGRLRAGMWVLTPRGPRRVVAVVRFQLRREIMCLVGGSKGQGGSSLSGLMITPWHPIMVRRGDGYRWVFPKDVSTRPVRYTGPVCSVLLERDSDPNAHAILVDGVWGVTLGHGLKKGDKRMDVRIHEFFGDYDKVQRALSRLSRKGSGVVPAGGVSRNPRTGLINGFVGEQIDMRKMDSLRLRKGSTTS